MVLTKVMENLEKQLRPAAGLRAKQQSNTMKSMKIAHKKMRRTSVQIYKSDRGISKSRSFTQCCSAKKKTFKSNGIPLWLCPSSVAPPFHVPSVGTKIWVVRWQCVELGGAGGGRDSQNSLNNLHFFLSPGLTGSQTAGFRQFSVVWRTAHLLLFLSSVPIRFGHCQSSASNLCFHTNKLQFLFHCIHALPDLQRCVIKKQNVLWVCEFTSLCCWAAEAASSPEFPLAHNRRSGEETLVCSQLWAAAWRLVLTVCEQKQTPG